MNRLGSLLPILPFVVAALWLGTRFRWFLGAFLIAHGLVHVMYFVPEPQDQSGLDWPFHLDRSWVLSGQAMRAVGSILAALAVVAFLVAAVAVLVDAAWWTMAAAAAAAVSLLLMILFLQPLIMLGILINVFVLSVALWEWPPVAFAVAGT